MTLFNHKVYPWNEIDPSNLSQITEALFQIIGKGFCFKVARRGKFWISASRPELNPFYRITESERRLINIDLFPTLGQVERDRENLKDLFYYPMRQIPLELGSLGRIGLYPTAIGDQTVLALCDIQPSRGFRHIYQVHKKRDENFYSNYPWVHYGLFFLHSLIIQKVLDPWNIKKIVAPTKTTVALQNHWQENRHGYINEGDRKRYYHRPFRQLQWDKQVLPFRHILHDEQYINTELWISPERLNTAQFIQASRSFEI